MIKKFLDLNGLTTYDEKIKTEITKKPDVVELTQAEYNALTTEEKNDNTIRFITDKNLSGGGGTTVVANPSGTATDDLTKVQIGSTIYDVTDKDAMRGVSIKVSSDTTAERYYLIWEHVGAPQGYISPLQISGDIGGWTGGTKFDVSCVFNNIGNIPRIYGFKESDVGANIIITRTSTSSSDSNTHDRIYIHFPVGIRYAEANLNIIPLESGNGQGTFYTNPTPTTTYEGTLATSLAACPVTNKLVGLSDVNISNPQNGQILQYDSTSGKWINHINIPTPEGATVTPTDDIQTWLHCANIWDKNYTTISAVLADSTTLLALISSSNAVDYMVRSTTWASDVCANNTAMTDIGSNNYCANTLLADSTWRTAICNSAYFESVLNVKVPTLSDYGNTVYSSDAVSLAGIDYAAWKAFDGNNSTRWNAFYSPVPTTPQWIGYHFSNQIKVNKAFILPFYLNILFVKSVKIQGSNNGNDWSDVSDTVTLQNQNYPDGYSFNFENSAKYSYYRLYISETYNVEQPNYNTSLFTIQFYGRA